jgi:ATP-dependent Clp protease adaptor protein ClpS
MKTETETETITKEKIERETVKVSQRERNLIVYNDEVNTFDFIIESLITVCKHEREQAEQCTHIIHYKGKCAVKVGTFRKLQPLCEALADRGISAAIE